MTDWVERAEKSIEKEYDEGFIDYSEYRDQMKDLYDELEQAKLDAAQEAYDNY